MPRLMEQIEQRPEHEPKDDRPPRQARKPFPLRVWIKGVPKLRKENKQAEQLTDKDFQTVINV